VSPPPPKLSERTPSAWLAGRCRSFIAAGRGLVRLVRSEPNFQIHLLAAVVAVGLGFWLGLSKPEWLILILTISLVLAMEALNSSVEKLTDFLEPRWHPLARATKDLAAAAVLVASIGAALIGLGIFGPKLWLVAMRVWGRG
jgi:diacylglycerol kinase